MELKRKGFEDAFELIQKYLKPTPLVLNEWLSKKYKCNIYLKLENLQPVGSFKLRGALNTISNFTDEQKQKEVLAVSAGNHAQGVAWAASKFKIKSTIIMPKPSPMVKIANTEALGAKVILAGENVDESFEYAKEYLKTHDCVYVHPFNQLPVIYGQGSIGYELKEQIKNIDYIFGSIGGGGLMSGVGHVVKEFYPNCKVIGSQSSGANSMIQTLQTGKLTQVETVETFADGIKVKKPEFQMYELLNKVIDEAVSVSDDKVAYSVLELMERARVIAEGAGAINLAAFSQLYELSPEKFHDKDIVLIICGGNIDINLVDRIIDNGLLDSKRRIKVDIYLEDKPGALNKLTQVLMESGANILQVVHKRDVPFLKLNQSVVEVSMESRGSSHADQILSSLEEHFEFLNKKSS